MHVVTLAISLFGIAGIFLSTPVTGFAIYLALLCWYPQNLSVQIGSADFTTGRIIIIFLFFFTLYRYGYRFFKVNVFDVIIAIFVLGKLTSSLINVDLSLAILREGSRFLEYILPYYICRAIINDKASLFKFIRLMILFLAPLTIIGLYQCITGTNLFGFLAKYSAWGLRYQELRMRMGLYRANASFSVHIIYGLFFAGLVPLCIGLWYKSVFKRSTIVIITCILLLGPFSSMSSGPLLSIMVSIAIMFLYPFRKYWPLFLVFIISTCMFLEYYSNRHWYLVFSRIAFSEINAYYRVDLVKEALGGGMSGHWVTGYGYVAPDATPEEYDTDFNWVHNDLVNIYVLFLVTYGLLGLLPYLCINFMYYKRLFRILRYSDNEADTFFVYCLMSTMMGWNIAMFTVAALNQVYTLLMILIGIIANSEQIFLSEEPVRDYYLD